MLYVIDSEHRDALADTRTLERSGAPASCHSCGGAAHRDGHAGRPTTVRNPSSGRVVVTGAAGFIGSHLVEWLLDSGQRVTGVDSFDSWYNPTRKAANLKDAATRPALRLETADLRYADLAGLFTDARVVYHLAARPGVQDSWKNGFSEGFQINVTVTQAVLDAALASGVDRVVLASSSSVYGDTAGPGGPRLRSPVSPYGVSKVACEHLAEIYRRRGLDVVVLRYFTVFGPRQRPDMAIHRMFEAVLPGTAVFERRGDGDQTREFTFVSDVVEATAAAGTAPEAAGRTFDIGGGTRRSLNEIIAAICDLTGTTMRLRSTPKAHGDPHATASAGEDARRMLRWQPRTPMNEGLAEQWAWHRGAWHRDESDMRSHEPHGPTPVRAHTG